MTEVGWPESRVQQLQRPVPFFFSPNVQGPKLEESYNGMSLSYTYSSAFTASMDSATYDFSTTSASSCDDSATLNSQMSSFTWKPDRTLIDPRPDPIGSVEGCKSPDSSVHSRVSMSVGDKISLNKQNYDSLSISGLTNPSEEEDVPTLLTEDFEEQNKQLQDIPNPHSVNSPNLAGELSSLNECESAKRNLVHKQHSLNPQQCKIKDRGKSHFIT